tara:strand:- start:1337 stop:1990 length:654 start_codon:yes stop_codon:yes gene_type:complete
MSHNQVTVNNQTPNNTGQITLGLSNIVSMTPNNGDVLQTDSSGNWVSSSVAAASVDSVLNISASFGYAVSTYKYSAADNLIIFKSMLTKASGITYVNAYGSYAPVSNSSWAMAYTFNGSTFDGKTVLFRAVPSPYCQASFVAQWGFGSGSLSSFTPIGPRVNVDNTHADIAWGRFVGDGTNKTVSLKIISRTGSGSQIKLATGLQAFTYMIDVKVLG